MAILGVSPDALRILSDDHLNISRLIEDVLINSRDSRDQSLTKLYETLMQHMRLEEKYLYAELEMKGVTHDLIRVSMQQHEQIRHHLQELLFQLPESDEWILALESLEEVQANHVEAEEQEVFPVTKSLLAPEELHRIARGISDERFAAAARFGGSRQRRRKHGLPLPG